jgi:hypothetical protein
MINQGGKASIVEGKGRVHEESVGQEASTNRDTQPRYPHGGETWPVMEVTQPDNSIS